jgi:hypothetical protein
MTTVEKETLNALFISISPGDPVFKEKFSISP